MPTPFEKTGKTMVLLRGVNGTLSTTTARAESGI